MEISKIQNNQQSFGSVRISKVAYHADKISKFLKNEGIAVKKGLSWEYSTEYYAFTKNEDKLKDSLRLLCRESGLGNEHITRHPDSQAKKDIRRNVLASIINYFIGN